MPSPPHHGSQVRVGSSSELEIAQMLLPANFTLIDESDDKDQREAKLIGWARHCIDTVKENAERIALLSTDAIEVTRYDNWAEWQRKQLKQIRDSAAAVLSDTRFTDWEETILDNKIQEVEEELDAINEALNGQLQRFTSSKQQAAEEIVKLIRELQLEVIIASSPLFNDATRIGNERFAKLSDDVAEIKSQLRARFVAMASAVKTQTLDSIAASSQESLSNCRQDVLLKIPDLLAPIQADVDGILAVQSHLLAALEKLREEHLDLLNERDNLRTTLDGDEGTVGLKSQLETEKEKVAKRDETINTAAEQYRQAQTRANKDLDSAKEDHRKLVERLKTEHERESQLSNKDLAAAKDDRDRCYNEIHGTGQQPGLRAQVLEKQRLLQDIIDERDNLHNHINGVADAPGLRKRFQDAESSLAVVGEERDQLFNELNGVGDSEGLRVRLQNAHTTLVTNGTTLDERASTIERLQAELASSEGKAKSTSTSLQEVRGKLIEAESQLLQLRSQAGRVPELDAKVSHLTQELQKVTDLEKNEKSTHNTTKLELENARSQLQQTKNSLAPLAESVPDLQQKLYAAEQDLRTSQDTLRDERRLKGQAIAERDEAREILAAVNTEAADSSRLRTQITSLQQEAANMRGTAGRVPDLGRDRDELRREINGTEEDPGLRLQLSRIKDELRRVQLQADRVPILEKDYESALASVGRVPDLERKLREAQQSLEHHDGTLIPELESALNNEKNAKTELQRTKNSLELELKLVKEEKVPGLESELKQATTKADATARKALNLEERLQQSGETIETLRPDVARVPELERKLREVRDELRNAKSSIDDLTVETNASEQLRGKLTVARTELQTANEELAELRPKAISLEKLATDLTDTRTELINASVQAKRVPDLEKSLDQTQEQLRQERTAHETALGQERDRVIAEKDQERIDAIDDAVAEEKRVLAAQLSMEHAEEVSRAISAERQRIVAEKDAERDNLTQAHAVALQTSSDRLKAEKDSRQAKVDGYINVLEQSLHDEYALELQMLEQELRELAGAEHDQVLGLEVLVDKLEGEKTTMELQIAELGTQILENDDAAKERLAIITTENKPWYEASPLAKQFVRYEEAPHGFAQWIYDLGDEPFVRTSRVQVINDQHSSLSRGQVLYLNCDMMNDLVIWAQVLPESSWLRIARRSETESFMKTGKFTLCSSTRRFYWVRENSAIGFCAGC